DGSVVVQPGAHAVVGVEPDPLQNGGIPFDGELVGPGTPMQIRDWTLKAVLDGEVIFALPQGEWDDPFGASIQLDPTTGASAAAQPERWCIATNPLANGDFGSPGAENTWCSHLDHDEDGVSIDDGDCDDTDPLISPGLPERWNGEDDDCDRITDELNPRLTGIGTLYGVDRHERMGMRSAFAVTDWDGDGTPTLAISRGGVGGRVVSFVDASVLIGSDNPITDVQQGTIGGGTTLSPTWLPRRQVDMDGDGDLDVTLVGSNRSALLWLIDAPPTGSAELTADDAQLRVTGESNTFREDARGLLHLDMNGDTFLDTVISSPSHDSDSMGFSQDGWIRVLDLNDVEGDIDAKDVRLRAWQGAESTGTGVTLAGDDLNGDGYDDLLFRTGDPRGAFGTSEVLWIAGGATLPESGATTDAAIATFTGLGSLGAGSSGADMLIEDFDADGSLDLLIGDPSAQAAHLFFDVGTQSGSIDVASADVTLTGISRFGVSLMWADVDGDGEADLRISDGELASRDYSRVFIYDADTLLSGSTVDVNQAKAFMQGPSETDAFGQWMWAGDLDNDPTRAELLIGSPGVDPTGAGFDQKGMIWVLPGGAL
ncbi:MAG: MopE-related protein, partial [Myxococcota bacterium]